MAELSVQKADISLFPFQTGDEIIGCEHHGQDDQNTAKDEHKDAYIADAMEGFINLAPVELDHIKPWHLVQPRHHQDAPPALLQPDSLKWFQILQFGTPHELPCHAGTGLKNAFSVEQKSVPNALRENFGHNIIEISGIHCGPYDPKPFVGLLFDGNDKVRLIPKS